MLMFLLGLFYLICVIMSYLSTKSSYSKGGRWHGLEPDFGDVFYTFCPMINILPIIDLLTGITIDKRNKNNYYSKFYRVK